MLKLSKRKTAKHKNAVREYPESEFIPYKCFWNNHTILTDTDDFMQIIRFGGYSFETADDEDVDIRKGIRNMLLKGVGSGVFALSFHMLRRKESVFSGENALRTRSASVAGFSAYLEDKWYEKHASHESFQNELYVSIIRRSQKGGVAGIESLFNKLQEAADKSLWERSMRDSYDEIDEMTSRVVSTLSDYKPDLLGVVLNEDGLYSEMLEFLGKLVNCGMASPMQFPTMNIAQYLPTSRLYFGKRAIEVKGPTGSRFAGIVSIKEYAQQTSANMMDSFLQMPFEVIISQSFTFIDRTVAINQMKIQQGRMINANDVAISQIQEIDEALDMSMSGTIGFGKHHLTVMCIEDTPKALESVLAMASTELGNSGIIPVRERVNLEPAYWAQLPGNEQYAVRRATINTLNLASFAALHNYPSGQKSGNHWGDAVTILDTTSGTPFFFNFHVIDVGHTTIIGPTGAGKTVLMNFLCAQARKFNCRMFFFDKDRGAQIFIRALSGVYTVIDPSKACGFNPLQLEDNGGNRNFLKDWFKSLVTVNGEVLTAEDMSLIEEAINGNFKLEKADRRLSNVAPFFGMGGPGSMTSRIAMWCGKGSHSRVFDNEVDVIDFDQSMVFGFEMAELLQDSASLGPVLLYLFHRINMSLDGTPSMIVLDEAWALIDNDVFAPKIKDWLKVLRKLNCFVIFATQSVEDASKSAISDTLIQQTATQIFLPNLKATDVYRTHFMLSQREFTLIKTTNPSSRFFLVKQGLDAVVARVDLSGMDDVISILSGRAETVNLFEKVIAEHGDDPAVWMPAYWKALKSLDTKI